ncbi:MAG: arginine repressor [Lachnospiraceae bacterium]|nr:arginine repressor [Lachnospiraceae bacterium]
MKSKRQAKMIEIIEQNEIETQDELAERLMEAGFVATQATISRDIRELKLTKVSVGNGKQKYILLKNQELDHVSKLTKVMRAGIIGIDTAENLVIIKTVSGVAMAVAAALDNSEIEGMVGCIAGDDTIFCAIKTKEMVEDVVKIIEEMAYH